MDGRFVQAPTTLSRRVGDEVLLTRVGWDGVDQLSPTAAAVWTLLDSPSNVPDLADRVSQRYSLDPRVLEQDIGTLLQELVTRGWVSEAPEDDA
jgi:hypothetical protein